MAKPATIRDLVQKALLRGHVVVQVDSGLVLSETDWEENLAGFEKDGLVFGERLSYHYSRPDPNYDPACPADIDEYSPVFEICDGTGRPYYVVWIRDDRVVVEDWLED